MWSLRSRTGTFWPTTHGTTDAEEAFGGRARPGVYWSRARSRHWSRARSECSPRVRGECVYGPAANTRHGPIHIHPRPRAIEESAGLSLCTPRFLSPTLPKARPSSEIIITAPSSWRFITRFSTGLPCVGRLSQAPAKVRSLFYRMRGHGRAYQLRTAAAGIRVLAYARWLLRKRR